MTAGHWDSIQITDGLEMYGRLCQSESDGNQDDGSVVLLCTKYYHPPCVTYPRHSISLFQIIQTLGKTNEKDQRLVVQTGE